MAQFGSAARCGQYINQFILAERSQNVAEMQRIQQTLAALNLSCPNIPPLSITQALPFPPRGSNQITIAGITVNKYYLFGGSILLILVLILALK